ncbi:hypothetical protein [Xanthobacter sp. 126]|uniref:hypothetical protein n=1 Tax=Xanthobacter sp. 126 TaxID=1131814 RepID=UPI00045E8558|nr:hypothetical protein [Xanthobacter sp. 126]
MASPLVTAADRMSDLRDLSIALNIVLGQGEPGAVVDSASTLSRVIEEMADQIIGLITTELDRQNPRLGGRKGAADG